MGEIDGMGSREVGRRGRRWVVRSRKNSLVAARFRHMLRVLPRSCDGRHQF